jgi:hypothetical protein
MCFWFNKINRCFLDKVDAWKMYLLKIYIFSETACELQIVCKKPPETYPVGLGKAIFSSHAAAG